MNNQEMISAREFAKRCGVSYLTVLHRLRSTECIPGATRVVPECKSYWLIPVAAIEGFKRKKAGRPGKVG